MTILLVAITTWSSAFPVISFGLEYFTPGELSFLRFLIASVCFLVLIAMRVIRLPPRQDWPAIALLGAIGIAAYQLLLGYAMTRVAAGAASILIALSPAVTSALAAWRLGERISTRMLIGLIVAFAGAVSVSLGSGSEFRFEPMALLIFGSVLATSIYFVWQKPLLARTSSLSFTAASIIAGTIVLAPFGLELSADLSWLSAQRWIEQVTDTVRGVRWESYEVEPLVYLSARIGYRLFDEQLDLGVTGNNLLFQHKQQHPFGQRLDTRVLASAKVWF